MVRMTRATVLDWPKVTRQFDRNRISAVTNLAAKLAPADNT